MSKPILRDEMRHVLPQLRAECAEIMATQIRNADHFIIDPEDCPCFSEYAQFLTSAELRACFKAARVR